MGFTNLFKKGGWSAKISEFDEGLHVVHDDPANPAVVDIVFIHGITGSPFRSWAKDPDQPPWIETLLPAQIPRARILTFGYHAHVSGVGSGVILSLRNFAESLIYDLAQDSQRKRDHSRPLIFVCHSMGGLVLQKALILANEDPNERRKAMFRCTHGIAFFGTPMRGTDLAGLANALRALFSIAGDTNRRLMSVFDRSSEELRTIQMSFRRLLRLPRPNGLKDLNIVCFFEAVTMYPLGLIVDEASATLEDYPQRPITADHINMVRFSSATDPGFKALVGALESWVEELNNRAYPMGLSADGWFQRGDKRYNDYLVSGSGSVQLEDAIFLFTEAARLAVIAKPRDSVTYARSHLGIARCKRELTFKTSSSYAELKKHLGEARTHLHRAYNEAVRMNSSALKLRVELELAVIGARQVQVEETESRLEPGIIASKREEVLGELSKVIESCTEMGKEDFREYGTKWLVKLGRGAPQTSVES
ncbi:hypothetical protein MFIFM68171_04931 [Madurella fahalii]|uniref:DUF676 domain-containing protein n=1 Tax=Madurella fahalii TaxID=1157608 RepID=A0ABQ0GAG2_9PEZI